MAITLKELLAKSAQEVSEFLSGIYEHSPWVSKSLTETSGYPASINQVTDLASAMKVIVDGASVEQKMTMLCAYPDLCAKVGKLEALTQDSQDEQSTCAGLQSLTGDELEKFTSLNTSYREKFKFPFILAVRNVSKYTVLSALEGRLPNSPEKEFITTLEQVHKIAWMRILSKLNTDDAPGFLTCHVLDTVNGCPGK
jgi:2-oxo-4-hydroxy-4-carboxy-5-ureidoimidazoline decarboxylase